MMYFVTGASGSGKTAILPHLRSELSFEWFDFDSVGVPSPVPKRWRHETLEYWVARAVEHRGPFGVCGQVPYGEILATPSAKELPGLAVCMLDCSDDVRIERLARRGSSADQDQLNWASWMRKHAENPTWKQDVIVGPSSVDMAWGRWVSLPKGDQTWKCPVFDTSALSIEATAQIVVDWVRTPGARDARAFHALR